MGGQDRSSSSVSIINGRRTERRSESYVFVYSITPEQAGRFEIPPVTVMVNGSPVQSKPVFLTAEPPSEREDLKVRVAVDHTEPYVGEPIELTVTLYLRRPVQRPTFRLPGLDDQFEVHGGRVAGGSSEGKIALLGVEVPAVRGSSRLDGLEYNTYTMSCYLVPLTAGRQELGPMTLACDIVVREGIGFFDSDVTETAVVPSNVVMLNVQPVPADGKPANFTGLVGRYRVSSSARPTEVNVGDPIVLTVQVQAEGPVLRQPDIRLEDQPGFADAFRVSDTQSEPTSKGGTLTYEFTIRPQSESVTAIPGIELPCFNTETGAYETVASDPIDLTVRPTRVVTANDAISSGGQRDSAGATGVEVSDVSEGIAHNYTAPSEVLVNQAFDLRSAVLTSPAAIAVLAGPPVAYVLCALWFVAGKSEERRRMARRRARALGRARQTIRNRPDESLGDVSRAVRGYLADRFDVVESALTTEECVRLAREVSPEAAGRLAHVLAACDAAEYGGADQGEGAGSSETVRRDALEALAQLDRSRGTRTGSGRARTTVSSYTGAVMLIAGVLCCLLTMPRTAAAQTRDSIDRTGAEQLLAHANEVFNQAIETRKTDPTDARAEFLESIDVWNRLVDETGIVNGRLYYNIGNAYLLAGDVGHAIANYRRAQRYERGDANLAANLDYARRQVATRIELEVEARIRHTLFFWHYDWSPQARFRVFLILFACAWCWALVHLWWPRIIGGGGSGTADRHRPILWPAFVIGCVSLTLFGSLAVEEVTLRSQSGQEAVVIRSTEGRKGPSEIGYEASFSEALAPGVEVSIEATRGDWVLVKLRDARATWLQREDVEVI